MHDTMQKPPNEIYFSMHALRGIAALLVVLYHYYPLISARVLAGSGYLAVDLFFVLSGFVIGRVYTSRFKRGLSGRKFIAQRLIRLYPLYIFGIVLHMVFIVTTWTVGFLPISISKATASFVFSLAFLPTPSAFSYHLNDMFPLNGPAWSLLLELLANIAFGLLFPFLTNRRLLILAFVAGVGVAIVSGLQGDLNQGSTFASALCGVVRLAFAFPVGLLIARVPRAMFFIPGWLAVGMLIAATAAMIYDPPAVLRPGYDIVVALVLWPALVFGLANAVYPAALDRTSFVAGEISYAIYCIHVPLLSYFVAIAQWQSGEGWGPHSAGFIVGVVAATLAFAFVTSRYYDVPVRSWLTAQLQARWPARSRVSERGPAAI